MFKSILTATLLITSFASFASVDCAKVGRSNYPVSDSAIKIATHLKVSTCDGSRFKAALSHLNVEMTLVDAPQTLIEDLESKRQANLENSLKGLSL